MNIAIVGAAELGKLIAIHAVNDNGHQVAGFYDDFSKSKSFHGHPVLGTTDTIIKDFEKKLFDAVIIAIGYNRMEARVSVFNKLKNKVPFVNIIHSSSYIDSSCKIGDGVFILPGVIIDAEVEIEDNVLINTGTIIAHHTKIGKHTFIAPGVHIAGLVNIEEKCFIGIGAIIKDCITIKKSSVVGAGSLVLKDTEENSVSVGSPSRIIKYIDL